VKKLEHLQIVGRANYKLFKKDLSAKGVPDPFCDLLFEKYVASKKRSPNDKPNREAKKACIEQKDECVIGSIGEFIRFLPTAEMDDTGVFLYFVLPLLGDSMEPKIVTKRHCYDKLWARVPSIWRTQRGVSDRWFSSVYHAWKLVKLDKQFRTSIGMSPVRNKTMHFFIFTGVYWVRYSCFS